MGTKHYVVYTSPNRLVALGAMKREYIELLMPWLNDPVVTAGVMLTPPVRLEDELAWYDRLGERRDEIFAILSRTSVEDEFEYVGHTGLHRITWPEARATTGTIIGHPGARGRGVGKEAKMLLLHHAFQRVGLRKVMSEVKAFNLPSIGHLVACGYEVVGVRKKHDFHEGRFVDQVLLEVHREAFELLWRDYRDSKRAPSLTKKQRARIQKLYSE